MDLSQLCLPVVLSAIGVFIASFLAWMVLPHHKQDVRVLPDEKAWIARLKELKVSPGIYMWPNCQSPEDMKSEEYKARFNAGPWGSLNILPGKPNFARNLILVFLFYVVVSVFVAYITGHARAAGAAFAAVFQVAGSAAILGYCAGQIPSAIFFGKPGRFVLTDLIDGVAYGLITGLIFACLWPAGSGLPSLNVPSPG